MKTKTLVLSLAILIILLQPAFNLAKNVNAQEQAQTTVRITPAQIENLAIGEYFSLNVSLENCVNVQGIQVDINYDPTVLQPVRILSEPTSVFPLIAINESNIFSWELNLTYNGPTYGQIYYAAARSGDLAGLNGEALLFTVNFRVISDGSTPIKLIQYAGDSRSWIGTYLMNPQLAEIIPQLYSANYGQPTAPTSPDSTSSNDTGKVQSATLLPYFLPFAALFLIVIGRKITRKTSNL
jgi:hypothetical protein